MTRESNPADDDALSWAGDDDPTLEPSDPAQAGAELAPGWSVVGGPGSVGEPDAPSDPAPDSPRDTGAATDSAALSSAGLIVFGVLGGVYLLYTIGWAISAMRIPNTAVDVIGAFMFDAGLWLAVLAPALWFALSFWLTAAGSRRRIALLILGVLVLVPLPFVAGVGVGA